MFSEALVVAILRERTCKCLSYATGGYCVRMAYKIAVFAVSRSDYLLYVRDMESLLMCSFRHLGNCSFSRVDYIYGSFVWFFQFFYCLWKLFMGSFSFVIVLEWFFRGFFLDGMTYLVVMQCWAYGKLTFLYSVTTKKKFSFRLFSLLLINPPFLNRQIPCICSHLCRVYFLI
jgi:hypothetical protein